VADFHAAWPWSERRWRFVGERMAEIAPLRWQGSAAAIGAVLAGARSVRTMDEPHLQPWLSQWAECVASPALFPAIDRRCDSFSQWWSRSTHGLATAADLLAASPKTERVR
jgi:deoxyribodipyrimidine photo-lyase